MRVRDLMTLDVLTVGADTTLKEASQQMVAARVSGLPVTDGEGRLIGIITEADFVAKEAARDRASGRAGLLSLLHGATPASQGTVGEVMTESPMTIEADADHTEAARIMETHGVKRIPVVDRERRVIGIISRADIINVFATPDEVVAETIREDVIRRVLWIDPAKVDLAVTDGRVTLRGTLPTHTDVRMLEAMAGRTDGVVSVNSDLSFEVDDRVSADSLPPDSPRPDW